jgi:hypothetical protein
MNQELYSFAKAVSFVVLGITAFSFGILAFAFINQIFPDPLAFDGNFREGLANALAAVIIAFPVYVVIVWRLEKARGEKEEPKIAKWLTYIVLVIIACIIIGDLIAVLSGFLRGELSTRFVLKALTILTIAGSIFGYYLWRLRYIGKQKPTAVRAFVGIVVAVIVLAVGYGLTTVGSPGSQRLIQFDERRVSDLQSITFAIDSYWEQNGALPQQLEDLRGTRTFVRSIVDPKSIEPYEYVILTDTSYQVCAVFETDSKNQQDPRIAVKPVPFSESIWNHGVGRACFEREAQQVIKEEPFPVPAR